MNPTALKKDGEDLPFEHENGQKKGSSSTGRAFMASFLKAKKDMLLYPAGNPVIAQSIQHFLQTLRELFSEAGPVELLVEKDRLILNGEEIGTKSPGVESLSLSLYRRSVRKLLIDPNIPFEEISTLFNALNMKREDVAEAGGMTSILKHKGISHAFVEETGELSVVERNDLAITEDLLPELEGIEDLDMTPEQLSDSEKFCSTFVRVEEEDFTSLKRLQTLLANPSLFSKILERFSIQIEKVKAELDTTDRVERLLEILRTMGRAIASLPMEDERSTLLDNLTISVLSLTANLRTELVSQGLVPNLSLRAIESSILGRFPVSRLTDALLNDFEMSGSTVSVMQTYFSNLDFSRLDSTALINLLRKRLDEKNMLSPEVEAVLKFEESRPHDGRTDVAAVAPSRVTVPKIEGYPADKVLFADGERERLMNQLREEFQAPGADLMVHAILELLRHEESSSRHAAMVTRAKSYMDHFLEHRNYGSASYLITGLRAEVEQKRRSFSESQLKPLRQLLDEYLGEERVQQLISTFKDLNRDSSNFEETIIYLSIMGEHATNSLLRALEDEESRHVRLLICQALAKKTSDRDLEAIGKKIDHSAWYVARNAVSVLGQIGKPECIPYLEKALSHENIRVRKEALKGLASIKTERAIDLVCSCVQDKDLPMRKAALGWAAVIGMEQILPMINKMLGPDEIWKQDNEVIRLGIEALENMESDSARVLLKSLSQLRSLFHPRKAAMIRDAAAVALTVVQGGQS